MGGSDKLSELILGRPMLEWSVAALAGASSVARVIVVTRADRVTEVTNQFPDATVVTGGDDRSASVRNGVEAASAGVVLVHDAARPLVSASLVDAVAAAAAEHGAAVPVIPVADSLKRTSDGRLESVDRHGLVRSQTPQGARRELLLDAFARTSAAGSYTDEAALLESRGVRVASVPGEATNIKVTEASDLEVVRAIAASRESGGEQSRMRYGLGQDSHGFGPEMGLALGGIQVADAPRLHGHSDGDVVLHALATAILSACSLGDIGRLFPASDATTQGISSEHLVEEAIERARDAGWGLSQIQVSVIGARPKLGATRIDAMRERIAELVRIAPQEIGISASTGNLYGPEGAGLVVSATCLVGVHRR
jgi:2-C-methyl-D-erythritol 4-phosphate cytidylyltransferase/2-C-methyl-D-erythritol 2,4-cyclodiphosphate synthase